jgi:hypothetical protein
MKTNIILVISVRIRSVFIPSCSGWLSSSSHFLPLFFLKSTFALCFISDSDHSWFGEKMVFPSDGQTLASGSWSTTAPNIRQLK